MKPTEYSWNAIAKTLHWLIVLMIMVEVPAGFLMTYLYGPGLKYAEVTPTAHLMGQIHHTNGFLILLVVCLRLGWRYAHPSAPLPEDLPILQRRAARATQGMLYALLLLLPLSGWMALSALADSAAFGKTRIWFFTSSDLIPRILPPRAPNAPYGYAFYAQFHRWFIYSGAALLTLHMLAALWHHFVRRDTILRSMWPLAIVPTPTTKES